MWRKTDEGKPSSPPSETTAPVPSHPTTTPLTHPSTPISTGASNSPVSTGAASGSSAIIPGLKIQGEISGTADLFIDGEVEGNIRLSEAKVTVGRNGRVHADIEARAIAVEGVVRGNLRASEAIYLGAHGRAQGSLIAPRLGIEEGARVSGKVDMKRPGEPREETGGPRKTEGTTMRRVAVAAGKESENE